MFDGLFEYENDEKLETFINSADKETALKMIELSIVHCQQNGFYTIEESHLIYKMLNKLKE